MPDSREDDPTRTEHSPFPPSQPPSAIDNALVAGAMLGQRYRIVTLLGRGGMGEVYRAEDLLLGETVALKFLPGGLSGDSEFTGRFRNEVRTARMVTHPNVCRVHDLAEAQGRPFLSMQFVDGEDLASLLRRIGRFPEDKGLEIARKLCAGLQAAHDRGVIHRDLKPANVMIDSRGEVVITDFGLAGLSGAIPDIQSGTPSYMAPEQRAGREVSARSDLYALGMVLHEVFTGKRPGSETTQLDPAIQAVLDRCLAADPSDRPTSALAIARALPGGDPLEAALAAGETPSPELVAAAGDTGTAMRIGRAAILALLALTGPFTLGWNGDRTRPDPGSSPEELAVRSRDLLAKLDPRGAAPPYSAWGFLAGRPAGEETLHTPDRFWYRGSPVALGHLRTSPTAAMQADKDPPLDYPGMTLLILDLRGRLVRYERVPDNNGADPVTKPPEATALLDWAGIAGSGLETEKPDAVWRYRDPGGAAYRIVRLLNPDGSLRRFAVTGAGEAGAVPSSIPGIVELILTILAIWFAVRNYRLDRIDWKGTGTLGLTLFLGFLVSMLLRGRDLLHWSPAVTPVDMAGAELLSAALVTCGYAAMEPFVRRRWPVVLITWTRLIHGRWKDPMVGRDILHGIAISSVSFSATLLLFDALGASSFVRSPLASVQSTPQFLAALLGTLWAALFRAVVWVFVFFVLRLTLRKDWLAIAAGAGLFTWMVAGATGLTAPSALVILSGVALVQLWILLRYGLVAKIAAEVVTLSQALILTLDSSKWYAGYSFAAIAWIALLAALAFRVATAGQAILPEE
ncbi:MAG: serine/threonine-protein kinase [Bryobacteraceae bacterium]